ncbi:MAG: helix-turn-helix domain-containing protein [Gaiellales bacterium]
MVTIAETPSHARPRVGPLLRDWRQRRRMSQMDLALEAGVSTRHLSFVETGRSRPSAEMVLHLAERLEVPLRERNELLLAAGFAPRYAARDFEDPALREVRDAVSRVLAAHEPYPAIAVDRYWNLIASNEALDPFLDGVAPELLVPPVNTIRLALHPDGVAPRILNLGEYRADLIERLDRAARLTGDPRLAELHEEMLGYPGERDWSPGGRDGPGDAAVAVGLRLGPPPGEDGPELSFFSTITTFGTPVDVTVSELAVEAFFPADEQTAGYLRT